MLNQYILTNFKPILSDEKCSKDYPHPASDPALIL